MSAEIQETNGSQIPSTSFLQAPTLSQSKSGKTPSQPSKGLDNTFTESPIEFVTASKPSDSSICEEANDSFVPKDENAAGLTLDIILGSTFRQIDLTTLQDFSSELFPNRPVVVGNQKVVLQQKKMELPEPVQKNSRIERERRHERSQRDNNNEGSLKTSTSFSPDQYPQLDRSRAVKKQSQKSLVIEKGDRVSQDAVAKPKEKSPELSLLRSRIKVKGLVKENISYSPSPIKTKNKFIESKRSVAEHHAEIGSISPTRSTECSIERKKGRAPRNTLRKIEDETRNLSFGVEGKSIDWHNRPGVNRNGSQIFLDKSQEKRSSIPKVGHTEEASGRGYMKILQMLNATGGLQNSIKIGGGTANKSKIFVDEDLRGEQWDLFKKYGAKFGIKAQEYFGMGGGTTSMIDPKAVGSNMRTKKVPTPYLKKRAYGEIDLARVKAHPHGYT